MARRAPAYIGVYEVGDAHLPCRESVTSRNEIPNASNGSRGNPYGLDQNADRGNPYGLDQNADSGAAEGHAEGTGVAMQIAGYGVRVRTVLASWVGLF